MCLALNAKFTSSFVLCFTFLKAAHSSRMISIFVPSYGWIWITTVLKTIWSWSGVKISKSLSFSPKPSHVMFWMNVEQIKNMWWNFPRRVLLKIFTRYLVFPEFVGSTINVLNGLLSVVIFYSGHEQKFFSSLITLLSSFELKAILLMVSVKTSCLSDLIAIIFLIWIFPPLNKHS